MMASVLSPMIAIMRLNKPTGYFLLLWPTLWSLWITANGKPSFSMLLIFVAGVFVMRSAGCVINDIADRKIDGYVERTKNRPLVTGQISLKQAILLFLVLSLSGFVLVLQLNTYAVFLSVFGLLLAVFYPFTKRYTHFPQVVLGLAFAWPVPMVFAAQCNHVPLFGWFLYLLAVLWPVGYDSIYALIDKEDDLKAGIKSTVVYFKNFDKVAIFIFQGVTLLGLFFLGEILKMGLSYFLALGVALAMVGYQYYLIAHRKNYQAFVNNSWMGFVIFVGIVLNYI